MNHRITLSLAATLAGCGSAPKAEKPAAPPAPASKAPPPPVVEEVGGGQHDGFRAIDVLDGNNNLLAKSFVVGADAPGGGQWQAGNEYWYSYDTNWPPTVNSQNPSWPAGITLKVVKECATWSGCSNIPNKPTTGYRLQTQVPVTTASATPNPLGGATQTAWGIATGSSCTQNSQSGSSCSGYVYQGGTGAGTWHITAIFMNGQNSSFAVWFRDTSSSELFDSNTAENDTRTFVRWDQFGSNAPGTAYGWYWNDPLSS
jgi:hypothetical protein